MKTKLAIIILCITSVAGFSQQFSGTSFDLSTGSIQIISGKIEQKKQSNQSVVDIYRKVTAEAQANINRMRAESEASEQIYQLRQQTEYLRQIASKK